MKNKKTLYIILTIVLLAIIGVGIWFFFFNQKETPEIEGCLPGNLYSMTSGERCNSVLATEVIRCNPGDLFSAVSGERCADSVDAE